MSRRKQAPDVVEEVRAVRKAISEECGHDPKVLSAKIKAALKGRKFRTISLPLVNDPGPLGLERLAALHEKEA
jgi:hypothetical protein